MNDKFPQGATAALSVDRKNKGIISTYILWITFVLAIAFTAFLLFKSRSVQNEALAKQETKDEIVSQLNSPSYLEIEKKANSFNQAFSIISAISGKSISKKELLSQLYGYFTKDVQIRNLALAKDGSVTIDGNTSSYRAVADFMTAVKSFNRVSEMTLSSVSLTEGEDIDTKKAVAFSINFILDSQKSAPKESLDNSQSSSDYSDINDYDSSSDGDLSPMDAYN